MTDIRLLQSYLETQALKNMNSPLYSADDNSDASLFSTMLATLLEQATIGDSGVPPVTANDSGLAGLKFPETSLPISRLSGAFDATKPTTNDIDALIAAAAEKYDLDPKLIRSVIQHESGFDPSSVSPAGAIGLMQLMPRTAAGLGVTDPFDPGQNIDGGAKYLKQCLDEFGGNKVLALAAYNAGPGNVKKYQGVPPFTETRNYVQKVLKTYYA